MREMEKRLNDMLPEGSRAVFGFAWKRMSYRGSSSVPDGCQWQAGVRIDASGRTRAEAIDALVVGIEAKAKGRKDEVEA